MKVSVFVKDSKQHKLKEFMRIEGVKQIRKQFAKYIALLREEFSQGLILPTKDSSSSNLKELANATSPKDTKTSGGAATNGASNGAASKQNGLVKIDCKKLTLNEEFKCRAEELYRSFVDVNV
jgi:activator of HSP90 ATPase